MNEIRCRQLLDQAIRTFAVDLSNLVVLTEAASGYYIFTPIIAALAGAKSVFAITRDSRFGTAEDITISTLELAKRFGIKGQIEILTNRTDPRISEADIVTNLGFVRPLDASFLSKLKRTAVIPLMWETWEFRPEDLDLDECRRLGISVLGTNEHHPDLQIFRYVGHLALKLLFESGIEVFRSKVLVAGGGEFAAEVGKSLRDAGATCELTDPKHWSEAEDNQVLSAIAGADALVMVEHPDRKLLIGPDAPLKPEQIFEVNPALTIVHICGGVDRESLSAAGIACWPRRFAPAGYMSVSTDYLGPRPLIDLHTAGLKVGEMMARTRARNLAVRDLELAVLAESGLAQGFADYHVGVEAKK